MIFLLCTPVGGPWCGGYLPCGARADWGCDLVSLPAMGDRQGYVVGWLWPRSLYRSDRAACGRYPSRVCVRIPGCLSFWGVE